MSDAGVSVAGFADEGRAEFKISSLATRKNVSSSHKKSGSISVQAK